MTPSDVAVTLHNGRGTIVVNGVDIAGAVGAMTIEHQPRGVTRIELELLAGHVAFTDRAARILLGPDTRAALERLGWTPPEDA